MTEPQPTRPTGTVTFLFTDIEGSTRLWEQQRALMHAAFPRQEAILRGAIAAHHGYAYKMIGDAFQALRGVAPVDVPATSPTRRVLSNLPAQLPRFIGRERAIADVQGLLEHTRLLTLTGSGGRGKTRLALEVGAAVLPIFADGVWL